MLAAFSFFQRLSKRTIIQDFCFEKIVLCAEVNVKNPFKTESKLWSKGFFPHKNSGIHFVFIQAVSIANWRELKESKDTLKT